MLCFSSTAHGFMYLVVSFFLNWSLKSSGVENSSKVGLGGGGGGLVKGMFREREKKGSNPVSVTRLKGKD